MTTAGRWREYLTQIFLRGADAYRKMLRLWSLARSNAMGTDEILNELLDALED